MKYFLNPKMFKFRFQFLSYRGKLGRCGSVKMNSKTKNYSSSHIFSFTNEFPT
ncbi:hypothetical protein LEP1GSC107_4538 [Leptospira interrogans serovar Grippotyphosa str. UI 12769]|nr:hypothetical protein LEP1GSC007_3453 [Leptospira interrogans serovar Bulgarica str. Mallika]EKR43520.1 hypothetical protein LEP1GSC097_0199 [Leptospira interrogans serovar Grippotyphosa str. UI 08368]EMN84769.1 hypothetical protein LEP1GSC107_4538 [Leptospira interrogans serovar Grippotyphosa str. UI 12769]